MRGGVKYNPLALFHRDVLEAYLREGYEYFVRQTYPRGIISSDVKESLLISPYLTYPEALAHQRLLRDDKRCYIYNMTNAGDRAKIFKAAEQPKGYRIHAAKIGTTLYEPTRPIATELTRFLLLFTDWRPVDIREIGVELYCHFGKILVRLQFGPRSFVVPLELLEEI